MLNKVIHLMNTCYKVPFLVNSWGTLEGNEITKAIFYNNLISGEGINLLEDELADFLNIEHVYLFNLGRSALEFLLKSLKLNGKEVILPTFLCGSVVRAVINAGGKPVFADISEHSLNIASESVENQITKNTRVVIMVHMGGNAVELKPIVDLCEDKKLFLIDDAAQALGKKIGNRYCGTFGNAGILSFGPGKVIEATLGGALITQNNHLFKKYNKIKSESKAIVFRRVIESFARHRYRSLTTPFFILKDYFKKSVDNSYPTLKMSNLDALIISVQLQKINDLIKRRVSNATQLNSKLKVISDLKNLNTIDSIYTKYFLKVENGRDDFIRYMNNKRIEIEWSYVPLHLKNEFKQYSKIKLGTSEKIWGDILHLPNHPILTKEQIDYMIKKITEKYYA